MTFEWTRLERLFTECGRDEELRSRLLADPRSELRAFGLEMPQSVDVQVVETTFETGHVGGVMLALPADTRGRRLLRLARAKTAQAIDRERHPLEVLFTKIVADQSIGARLASETLSVLGEYDLDIPATIGVQVHAIERLGLGLVGAMILAIPTGSPKDAGAPPSTAIPSSPSIPPTPPTTEPRRRDVADCPECGYEAWIEGESCIVCGFGKIGELILEGPGGRATFAVPETRVGKNLLRSIAAHDGSGSEARFASDLQFRLLRTGEGWFIAHAADAKNRTGVNDQILESSEPRPLDSGDVVMIVGRDGITRKCEVRVA